MSEPTSSEVLLAIGRLEGKVDSFLNAQANQQHQIDSLFEAKSRIDRKLAWVIGALSVSGAIALSAIALFRGMLKL